MKILIVIIGTAAVLALAILVATALKAAASAVRIGGRRLLFNGIAWIVPPPDLPPAARPHLRRAVTRWLGSMGCLALAAICFAMASGLP